MTEIKKATIDDVDVGRFESKVDRPGSGYNFAAIVARGGAIELHSKDIFFQPVDSTLRMRRYDFGWRTSGSTQSEPVWLRYAFDVADEFESWLATELARIDRERKEAAKQKTPTVKAPDGAHWELVTCQHGGIRLVDDAHGHSYVALRPADLRSLECEIALLKARAEVLGKRIVVLDEAENCFAIATAVWIGKEL